MKKTTVFKLIVLIVTVSMSLVMLSTTAYAYNNVVTVTVKTTAESGAGTNANVNILLVGTKGTSVHVLDTAGYDDFEQGDLDTYTCYLTLDIGDLKSCKLSQDGTGSNSDWHVDYVKIQYANLPNTLKTCNFYKWIGTSFTEPFNVQ